MRRLLPFVVLLTLSSTACGTASEAVGGGASSPSFAPIAAPAGDALPDVSLPVLGEDRTLAMSELAGTPAVVNFWATWCAFCVEEMPDLEAAHQQLGDAVRFLGVDVQDSADRAADFVAEVGVSYPSVEDVDRSFFTAVEGRGMPTTLLVDAEGAIRYRHTGPLTTEQLLALVEEHLGVRA